MSACERHDTMLLSPLLYASAQAADFPPTHGPGGRLSSPGPGIALLREDGVIFAHIIVHRLDGRVVWDMCRTVVCHRALGCEGG